MAKTTNMSSIISCFSNLLKKDSVIIGDEEQDLIG